MGVKINDTEIYFVIIFQVEDLFLLFARKASEFNSWFENAEEDLTDPVRCNSVEQVKALLDAHTEFRNSLDEPKENFKNLVELDAQIKAYDIEVNPYVFLLFLSPISFIMFIYCKTITPIQSLHDLPLKSFTSPLRPFAY